MKKDNKTLDSKKNWFVYMIRCSNGNLYTGITTDVQRRFQEHQEQGKKTAKYLRGKKPLALVCVIDVESRKDGLCLEHQIKNMSKSEKEEMLQQKRIVDSSVRDGT